MRLHEITSKPLTIMTSTNKAGGIDPIKSTKMVDPKGYFSKNKSAFKRSRKMPKV